MRVWYVLNVYSTADNLSRTVKLFATEELAKRWMEEDYLETLKENEIDLSTPGIEVDRGESYIYLHDNYGYKELSYDLGVEEVQ